MPGLVHDVTRIWELNTQWPAGSQCAIWDPKGMRVVVWESVVEHIAAPGTEPPNARFWRYVARR